MSPSSGRPDAPGPAPHGRERAAAAPAAGRPPLRLGLAIAIATALLLAAALGALAWALGSAQGTAALLRLVPGLSVVAPRGRLLGDFSARQIAWQSGDGLRLTIDDLRWQGFSVDVRLQDGFALGVWGNVHLNHLSASRIDIQPGQSATPPTPLAAPQSLRLPLELRIDELVVGEVRLPALGDKPLRDIAATIDLGANGGALHRVDSLRLQWDRLTTNSRLQIASRAPLDVQAAIDLAPLATAGANAEGIPAPPIDWRASVRLQGPLERIAAGAALRTVPSPSPQPRGGGAASQALDLSAVLRPFEAWPLAALAARTQALDLSQLASGAPVTAIDATVDVQTEGWRRPAQVVIALDNRAAGRINERRVPLASLRLDVEGRPDQPTRLDVRTFDARLAAGRDAGGRIEGSGVLDGERLELQATLRGVRPAVLDAKLAGATLDGTVQVEGRHGLPIGAVPPDTTAQPDLKLRARLAGPIDAVAQRMQFALDVAGTPQRIDVQRIAVAAGDASAELSGRIEQAAGGAWRVQGKAKLERFDPLAYWRGPEDSPWRRGPHRVNANAAFDLRAPEAALRGGGAALQRSLRGEATLQLRDSLVAGVPVSGEATLRGAAGLELRAALDAANNHFVVDGRTSVAPAPTAARDMPEHWKIEVNAPALAQLAPLAALARPTGVPPLELDGELTLRATVDGRWPRLATSGEAYAKQARVGSFATRQAQLSWTFATPSHAPLELKTVVEQLSMGNEVVVESATVNATGSLASHQLELRASTPVRPPEWVDRMAADPVSAAAAPAAAASGTAAAPAPGSQLVLLAHGSARGELAAAGGLTGWQGSLRQLDLQPRASAAAARWLSTRELALAVDLDPSSYAPTAVVVEPGRIEIVGAALRFSRIAWRSASGTQRASLDAQGELEPIAVAPLLARLQPAFGWVGDLRVGGQFAVRSTPDVAAEIVVERSSGDLGVRDLTVPEMPVRSFGLTDLRLALTVRDGVWQLTQALAGTHLGNAAGAQIVRTSPQTLWPTPETPLEGVLQANVADLGSWGGWLPPGWRLVGTASAGAAIGGRFGAPEYTGELRGTGIGVRNVLQGVDVHDGELKVSLQGERARIETFRVHAGDGTAQLSGEGRFGADPRAQLQLGAERFALLARVDRRIAASGQAAVQLDTKSIAIDGHFTVDEGLIDFTHSDAPTLGDDVEVLRPDAERVAVENGTQRESRRMATLDLLVDLGRKLRLRGRGLDTLLRGELRITAPGGRLAVNGTVRAEEGTYTAYQQNLEIERGFVRFNGPVENPGLEILAIRPNLDVRVGVGITGTALAPRVKLVSEPEMSDSDKLTWLVLGREPGALGRSDTAVLQSAALALFAGEGGGPADDLARLLPLDTLSVGRRETGSVTETVVSLGRQVSKHWYIGYERSLDTSSATWQLIYRVAQHFTLRAEVDAQTGENSSFDAIWIWRWR
jgi:translocation and assembly module TamB